ncbi:uncharacterized protein LOC135371096 [Ornithodoros turicata]|uniref:uncharacterized protein LOC135371096 n=1 Tax=Ornithodoros turicata TaxID=34597 RepID=UPI00313902E3
MSDNEKTEKTTEAKRSSSLLSTLRRLSDTNREARILAGEALLKELSNKSASKDEDEFRTTVEYLVKGLSSSQRSSRVGFTTTLIQILQTFANVPAQDVLKYMNKHLALDAKENKNHVMIGRSLALSSIVRSGRAKAVSADVARELLGIPPRSPCTEVLVCEIFKEFLSQVKKESFRTKLWPVLESALSGGWDSCSPFTLFLLCSAAQKSPETVGSEFLKEHWGCNDILSKKNVPRIVAVLQSSLSTLPHIHPVCRSILEYALSKNALAKAWKRFYCEGLMESSTDERTYIIMELLPWCISQLSTAEEVDSTFTEQLRKVLLQTMTNSTHILHAKAQDMARCLLDCAKSTEDVGVQIALLGFFVKPPSSILFDQVSKSKTVQQLLANASTECVLWYGDFLRTFLQDIKTERGFHLGHQQSQAFEQLSHLLNLPAVQSSAQLRSENLRFLVEIYSTRYCGAQTSEMQSPKRHLQSAILKALVPSKKSQTTDFVQLLVSLLTDIKEHGKLDTLKLLTKSLKIIKKMEKKEMNHEVATSLKLLLGYLSILVFLGICEDNSILEDIQSSAKAYVKDNSQTEDSVWVDTIMETLLNMLAMTSQAVRTVTVLIFSLLHKHMSDDALHQLLSAFGTKKEEEEDEGEFIVDDDESSDSDSSDSENEEDETAETDDELRDRLRAVFGDDEHSDEEGVLTDKEMFELDNAISAAFKARMGESKSERVTGIHFQVKCLELLQEYIGSHPPVHHLIKIGSVLVAASTLPNFKSEKTLISSISDTLRLMSAVRKFSSISDVRNEIMELTKSVLDQVSKVSNLQLKNVLGIFSAFLVLCYKKVCSHLGHEENSSSWYLQLYMDSLKAYLEHSSHISPLLFVKFMETHPEYCYDFIVSLEEKASACMEEQHMRLQIFGLLVAAIRLLQGEALPASKRSGVQKIFKKLTDTAVKALEEMAKNKEVKTGMTMEFADLLLVISKQSSSLGFQHPFQDNEALSAALETLTQLMGHRQKNVRRRVGQVLKEINKENKKKEKPKKNEKRKHQDADETAPKKKTVKSE